MNEACWGKYFIRLSSITQAPPLSALGPNVNFYLGRTRVTQNLLSIEQILSKRQDYEWLQTTHDYIQWLFPNHYQSKISSQSKALTEQEASTFRGSKQIGRMIMRSFELYCNSIGIEINYSQLTFRIVSEKRVLDALRDNRGSNDLRVRRILTCLSTTGFRCYALWFLSILTTVIGAMPALKRCTRLTNTYRKQWQIYSNANIQTALKNCFTTIDVFDQINPSVDLNTIRNMLTLRNFKEDSTDPERVVQGDLDSALQMSYQDLFYIMTSEKNKFGTD